MISYDLFGVTSR